MAEALVTFSPAQLAIIVGVLALIVWAGFKRLIGSIDQRFDKLEASIDDIRENHPTKDEVSHQISGVHRRIDDINLRRRHDDPTGPVVVRR